MLQSVFPQQADVVPEEVEEVVLPVQAGDNLGGVALGGLLHGQVGGDYRPFARHQPGVYQLVQGGLGKLGGQLTAQIVQNEQVAVKVAAGFVPGVQAVPAVPEPENSHNQHYQSNN